MEELIIFLSFFSQYNKVYKSLKELAQNGENFCKQITSVLQQRYKMCIWDKQSFLCG